MMYLKKHTKPCSPMQPSEGSSTNYNSIESLETATSVIEPKKIPNERALGLTRQAAIIQVFLKENMHSSLSFAHFSAIKEALNTCASVLSSQDSVTRAADGLSRLYAVESLLACHKALVALKPHAPAQAVRDSFVGASCSALEREATTCLRRQYLELFMDVENLLHKRTDIPVEVVNENTTQTLVDSLSHLNKISIRLGQNSSDLSLMFSSNDIAEKCCKMLARLATKGYALPDQLIAYKQPSLQQLEKNLIQLPQYNTLPPLHFGTLVTKNIGSNGHSNYKHFLSSAKETFSLGANLSGRAGAHGRVHQTRVDTSPKEKMITKVQRSQQKIKAEQSNHSMGTEVISLDAMLNRTSRAEFACAKIDKSIAFSPELFSHKDGLLRGFRANKVTTALKHHFVDPFGKYYQIMPAMAGDLADLSMSVQIKNVDNSIINDARTSIGAQSFFQLGALHGKPWNRHRLAHLDLKLTNILFDQYGAVRLIDFDESKEIDWRGYGRDPFRRTGSLLSPELNLPSLRNEHSLGAAYDVWTLGLVLLEFGFCHDGGSPFVNQPMGGHPAVSNPTLAMAAYSSWYDLRIASEKTLQWPMPTLGSNDKLSIVKGAIKVTNGLRHIDAEKDATYVIEMAHFFDDYFNKRALAHPALVSTVLKNALQPKPQARASAPKMAHILLSLMEQMDDQKRQNVAFSFDEAAKKTEMLA